MCMIIFRVVQSSDVSLKIIYYGVYHVDVISTQNKHNNSNYPLVPGQAFQINMYIESLRVKNIIVRECCPLAKRGVCTVYLCRHEIAGDVRRCLNPGAKG